MPHGGPPGAWQTAQEWYGPVRPAIRPGAAALGSASSKRRPLDLSPRPMAASPLPGYDAAVAPADQHPVADQASTFPRQPVGGQARPVRTKVPAGPRLGRSRRPSAGRPARERHHARCVWGQREPVRRHGGAEPVAQRAGRWGLGRRRPVPAFSPPQGGAVGAFQAAPRPSRGWPARRGAAAPPLAVWRSAGARRWRQHERVGDPGAVAPGEGGHGPAVRAGARRLPEPAWAAGVTWRSRRRCR
jgi:hypothetical protein